MAIRSLGYGLELFKYTNIFSTPFIIKSNNYWLITGAQVNFFTSFTQTSWSIVSDPSTASRQELYMEIYIKTNL